MHANTRIPRFLRDKNVFGYKRSVTLLDIITNEMELYYCTYQMGNIVMIIEY